MLITGAAFFYHPAMRVLFCRSRAAALWFAVVGLVGCSTLDLPHVELYPASGQRTVASVHHWDVLAQDVAQRVSERIATWPQGEHPIHVVAAGNTDFSEGFVKLLRVHLLEHGVSLSAVPAAVQLRVQVQLVRHGGAVVAHRPALPPAASLGEGIAVSRDWQAHEGDRARSPEMAAGGPTHTELLITTTLENENRYLTGTADMYYVDRTDASLYEPPPPPPPAPPVKTWKVVTP